MRTHYDMAAMIQAKRRRNMFKHYLVTNSAHTPTPERMFEALYRKGVAYVQRRRGKPPLLVFVKDV